MCTGRNLVAGVTRARLTYAENRVSCVRTACLRGRAYSGRACMRGVLVRRWWAAGVGATAWVQGVGAWHLGWAASVSRVPIATGRTREGGVRVDAWRDGRLGVFPLCWVGHAWTFGLVRRPVALSGLLLLWPSDFVTLWLCVRSPWLTPIQNSSELLGLCRRSYFGPRTCVRGITNASKLAGLSIRNSPSHP